ncbi:mitochondrial uncoupling protein 3 [Prunus yedoensis var. nudiflora]|uniref:Mitochondrial uncoupling protein 3 n=1 Tax=Prunus yedoensis var. nudiflora TaxID=2094558 RepID=A0A314ZRE7_PRUYE|nr:mitochondrial uncoupling protein 3 [Prunus yedoensis var. nudiflora]
MKPSEDHGAYRKILLASISAMVAETTTFPIDLTKTRLQLHGESVSVGSARPTNGFLVASEIVRQQGPLGLYKGLSPAILRHLFYTPIRIVGYEHLRSSLKTDGASLSLPAKALSGGISGVVAQLVASPADLVKVRMQADGRMVSQGLQPRYSGCFDALNKIVNGGHWRTLERGFP